MIVRTWLTRIDESRAAEYAEFAQQRSLPMFQSQPGFAGVLFGAQPGNRVVITFWDDSRAIEALDTSESYQATVAAIEATGFLRGQSSVEVFEVQAAMLDGKRLALPEGRTVDKEGNRNDVRNRVKRSPHRAVYDQDEINEILDEGIIAHIGFVDDGQAYVIPTLYARVGERIYIHGASAGRAIRGLTEGLPACLTVTLTDGIVLARSAVNHSMNYRSVVVLGTCHPIEESDQRGAALRAFSERLIPGRWAEVRTPSREELQGTRVLAMDLSECSAKRRNGPPEDDEADYELPVWAGVIPLRTVVGPIITDPRMTGEYEPSAAVTSWRPTAQRR